MSRPTTAASTFRDDAHVCGRLRRPARNPPGPRCARQQAADTIVTHGQDPHGRRAFTPSRRWRSPTAASSPPVERGDRALRGQEHEGDRRRRRHRHPGPHRQPRPLHARRRDLARAGPVRRRRLASRSAADPRRKAASLTPGDWIMVQGGWTPRQFADAPGGFTLQELDGAAPKNPLFVQEGYSVVYANSLALKAVGLNPRTARVERAGSCVIPAPYALYDACPDLGRAARAEPHGFHARAELDRPHGRLQPGAIGPPGRARREGPAAGQTLGDAEFQRGRSGLGVQSRRAHRAHAREPVRRPARHLRPGRGSLRAVLDLAPARIPGPPRS